MAPETPKGVSSRLLTMKFMQRAIASNSTAVSPESESHSAKKRKLDHGSPAGRLSMDFDQASVDAAMQAQEAKRKAALEQHATGDTHWVLRTKLEKPTAPKPVKAARKIVFVGYGDIDSENDSGEDVAANGRTSTRKPRPKNESSQNPSDDESGSGSDEDSDDGENSTPRQRRAGGSQPQDNRSRSKSRVRPTASELKAKELRDKRRKKEVRLNNITSISGAGDSSPSTKSMTCYNCHQPGHRANDCPKRKSGGRGRK